MRLRFMSTGIYLQCWRVPRVTSKNADNVQKMSIRHLIFIDRAKRGRCFDLNIRHLPSFMKFGTNILGRLVRSFISLVFLFIFNGGRCMGILHSYGQKPWPTVTQFQIHGFVKKADRRMTEEFYIPPVLKFESFLCFFIAVTVTLMKFGFLTFLYKTL